MDEHEMRELRDAVERGSATRREQLNLPEPNPVPRPPKHLGVFARAVWRRVAPEVAARGKLRPGDLDQFAIYCDTLAKLAQASEALGVGPLLPGRRDEYRTNPVWKVYRELNASARMLGADFGLTPGARSRLRAGELARTQIEDADGARRDDVSSRPEGAPGIRDVRRGSYPEPPGSEVDV